VSLDWANERYVRVYTRDTTTWKLCDWRARTVLLHLFRKVDRSGVLDVGDDGVAGLAAVLELPLEEIVEPGIAQLVKRGTVERTADAFVLPNFIEAQEMPASDAQRQRVQREKRRADKRNRDGGVTNRDALVTTGHATSRDVTPNRTVPIRSEPCLAEPEREPSPSAPAAPQGPPALALVPQEAPVKVARKAPSKPLPADWKPSPAHEAFAIELAVSVPAEAEKMRDWATANGERKADWDAAFRGWLRRASESRAGPRGSPPPPRDPRVGYSPARHDSHITPDGIVRTLTEL